MKIHLYSNTYNEEALLPYWLKHYETFVDRIFIWDGGSTDNTLQILKAHSKVTLLPRDIEHLDDHYFVDVLYPQYEIYSRDEADWVIIADADEFIYHSNIREVLKQKKSEGIQFLQCNGFEMISETFPTTTKQIYDEIYLGVGNKYESKWTVFSPEVTFRFYPGRHGRPPGIGKYTRDRYSGIKLLHYRFIGKDYTIERDNKNYGIKNIHYQSPEEMVRKCPNREYMQMSAWIKKYSSTLENVVA